MDLNFYFVVQFCTRAVRSSHFGVRKEQLLQQCEFFSFCQNVLKNFNECSISYIFNVLWKIFKICSF